MTVQNDLVLDMHGIEKDYVMGEEVSHVLKGIDLQVHKGSSLPCSDLPVPASLH